MTCYLLLVQVLRERNLIAMLSIGRAENIDGRFLINGWHDKRAVFLHLEGDNCGCRFYNRCDTAHAFRCDNLVSHKCCSFWHRRERTEGDAGIAGIDTSLSS